MKQNEGKSHEMRLLTIVIVTLPSTMAALKKDYELENKILYKYRKIN